MVKKVLVFLTATLLVIFIGLLVIYFYSHKSINKKNSILTFIPPQTDFVIRIKETSVTNNSFFSNPLAQQFFKIDELSSYWRTIDSVTSRNYKTAEVLSKNTSYICIDSTNFLILVDLNKKTNEQFIDQFLSNSTNHRKIEKFKEGYRAFYPKEREPMYYFIKHSVFALSGSSEFLLSSLKNTDLDTINPLINNWNNSSVSAISIWGKRGTETSVMNSFVDSTVFFNGWIDQLCTDYFLDLSFSDGKMEWNGQLNIDSEKLRSYHLVPSGKKENIVLYQDKEDVINESYSTTIIDSLGKEKNLIYTYHQFRDSANNHSQLIISNSELTSYMFSALIQDTSVQLITMDDEKIEQVIVAKPEHINQYIPIIPIGLDTGDLFIALYTNYFIVSNSTTTVLQAVPLIESNRFVKKSLEKGAILSRDLILPGLSFGQSQLDIKWKNGVMYVNCVFTSKPID